MHTLETSTTKEWLARLDLDFHVAGPVNSVPASAALEASFSTNLKHRHLGPLRIQKALYPEGPGLCHAIIVHPPGGIAGGDRLEVQLRSQAHSQGLVTTPSAAKW
jgi:urease accessory protein